MREYLRAVESQLLPPLQEGGIRNDAWKGGNINMDEKIYDDGVGKISGIQNKHSGSVTLFADHEDGLHEQISVPKDALKNIMCFLDKAWNGNTTRWVSGKTLLKYYNFTDYAMRQIKKTSACKQESHNTYFYNIDDPVISGRKFVEPKIPEHLIRNSSDA